MMTTTTTLSPNFSVQETDFNRGWVLLLGNITKEGIEETFIGNNGPINVCDTTHEVSLTGYALEQILRRNVHPQCPYLSIDAFCREWTYGFAAKYLGMPCNNRPDYLAMDRLTNYPGKTGPVDQIAWMRKSIADQIGRMAVNDCQAISWVPEKDLKSDATPYIQRIWVRVYPGRLADVQIDWRATDAYNRFQSRIVCAIRMIADELMKPNDCRIARVINRYNSLFVIETDFEAAKKVEFERLDPRKNYQRLY